MSQRLIIFTRYPHAGSTKTRLIPALGATGAADLQRQMTEHTLAQARALRQHQGVDLEVRYTGADGETLARWLGSDVDYQPQGDGDLGDRMAAGFAAAFAAGYQAVVTIGIDCPDLDTPILTQAFAALSAQDLVLGPAIDGGYYLIGLRQAIPVLFQNMAWGTDQVLADTLGRASQAQMSVTQLPLLHDIDRPEDLVIWDRFPRMQIPTLSVIIPTLNEAPHLEQTLEPLHQAGVEILVVDGGSRDGTPDLARRLGAKVLETTPGRAQQMNLGASHAQGSLLLFLHGDTRLPSDFVQQVQVTLAQPKVVAGAFRLHIAGAGWCLRWVEWGTQVRSHYCQLPYGDQGLFLWRSTFEAVGQFADLPIMEDFELVQRLQSQGRIALAPAVVQTSDRRWRTLGVLRTTVINQAMILGYGLGIDPHRLARFYRGRSAS